MSHNSLPDWRVEKSAMTSSKFGYKSYFAGPKSIAYNQKDIFAHLFTISWQNYGELRGRQLSSAIGNPLYWHAMKKQAKKIVDELRPDIIHAHNLYSAKLALSLKMPFVYDDHEFWSQIPRIRMEKSGSKIARRFLNRFIASLWSKWEREIVSTAPVITTSEKVSEHHKEVGNNNQVFFVPNYPAKNETNELSSPQEHAELSSVYLGADDEAKPDPHRNVAGLTALYRINKIGSLVWIGIERTSDDKITYKGYLPRDALYKEMSNHSIGLLPWRKHWSHSYFNPNKPYEYAHAGLLVICNSIFDEVLKSLRDNCMTFCSYEDLVDTLVGLGDNMEDTYKRRVKTFEFARNNLLWEKNEMKIIHAYRCC